MVFFYVVLFGSTLLSPVSVNRQGCTVRSSKELGQPKWGSVGVGAKYDKHAGNKA